MSRVVDDRIVKMSLDNKKFEADAIRTVGIFGKLQSAMDKLKGVRLDKSVKDITDLNNAAGKTSLSKLSDSVQTVASKFGALSIIGITALTNITNKAVDAGMRMAKAFTTKPIMDGFEEYELKMGSIQTILANTSRHGTKLKDVTKSLDELNLYADKTIYNFGDMTRNIGLFTNAGIKVEEATSMIKGFSNEAAASGTTSQGAAGAAYQLSQALSAGTIRLMDWRSLTNVGMGNKNMQLGLIEIAEAMGTLNETSTSAESIQKDFNASLESNWLSADVMSKYLQIMAGDLDEAGMAQLGLSEKQIEAFKKQAKTAEEAATKVRTWSQLLETAGEALGSGWTETWDMLLGDFEEATVIFSAASKEIDEIIGKSSKARNDMINDFVKLGGRTVLINSVANAFKGLSGIVDAASKGIRNVFPPTTGKQLLSLAKGIEDFTKKLMLNEKTLSKITTIFQGFASVVDIGITVVKIMGNALKAMIPDNLGGTFLDLAVKLADWVIELNKAFKDSDIANSKFKKLSITANDLATAVGKAMDFLGKVFDVIRKGADEVYKLVKPTFDALIGGAKELIASFSAKDLMTGGVIGMLFLFIKKLKEIATSSEGFISKIKDLFDGFKGFENVTELLDGLKDSLSAMTTAIKSKAVLQIAIAVGVLALSLKLLATIDLPDISKGLAGLAGIMFLMTKSLGAIGKQKGSIKTAFYATTVLPALSLSVVGLAAGLKIFASMNTNELIKGIGSLTAVMTILVTALIGISKFGGKIATSSLSIVALSTAVLILTQSVKQLSKLNQGEIIQGVLGLGAILLELSIFLRIVDKMKFSPASAIAITIISGAILIMVEGIRQISAIPVDMLQKGLVTIGIILAEIAIFVRIASGAKVMSAATGMVIVAQAIKMLIPPIKDLGSMDVKTLAKGLGAMAIALGEVVLAMKIATGSMGGATAILIVAGAINALIPPLQILGNMSVEQLAKGLIAMAGALTIVAVASKLIGVGGSVALLAFAAAITAVGIAAVAISVALNVFIAALNTLAVMSDTTVKNIGRALGSLVTEVTKLIPKLVKMATILVVELALALAIAAPQVAASGLKIVVGFLKAIADNIGDIVKLGADIVIALMEGLGEKVPELITAGVQMITDFINGLADGIRDNGPALISALFNLMESLLEIIIQTLVTLLDTLFGWIPGVSGALETMGDTGINALRDAFNIEDAAAIGNDGAQSFVDGVGSNKDYANKTGKELAEEAKLGASLVTLDPEGKAAGVQYNKGLDGNKFGVKVTGKNVADSGKSGAAGVDLTNTGKTAGSQYDSGVASTKGKVKNTGKSTADSAKSGASLVKLNTTGQLAGEQYSQGINTKKTTARSSGSGIGTSAQAGAGSISLVGTGANTGEGFAQGIESKSGRVEGASSSLASKAKGTLEKILKIFSPSRVMRADGSFFGEGFALGIEDEEHNVSLASESLANRAVSAMRGIMEVMGSVLADEMDFQPHITPVLDMSNVNMPNLNNKFGMRAIHNFETGENVQTPIPGDSSYQFNIYTQAKDAKAVAREVEKIIVDKVKGVRK